MPAESSDLSPTPTDGHEPDFAALAQLRRGLAELDAFVHSAGGGHGCSAAMYQLLLALKTSRRGSGVDIGMLATALGVRHPPPLRWSARRRRRASCCRCPTWMTAAACWSRSATSA